MRTTHYSLKGRVYALNDILGKPVHQFSSKVGDPVKFTLGHLCLTHDATGYTLEEQVSEAGAVNVLACGKTAHEMDIFLDGVIRGITLRHEQMKQQEENK